MVVCLDGEWADPPLASNPRLTVIHHSKSIGQRAATNEAVRASDAHFVCKLDGHCIVSKDFDQKMVSVCEPDMTLVPRQYNLYAFDRNCLDCGHEAYQGPPKCEQCGSANVVKRIIWLPRDGRVVDRETLETIPNPTCAPNEKNIGKRVTDSWVFDRDLHFQYFGELAGRQDPNAELIDTMSLLGACWMMPRERYDEIGGLDEAHSSWGQMGTEVACKSLLSGGQLKTYRGATFAHLFRTQVGFGFPYPTPNANKAREYSKWLWRGGNWPLAKYPLSWLVERFMPLGSWWSVEDLERLKQEEAGRTPPKQPTKGVVYYSHLEADPTILQTARDVLRRSINGHELVSVTLNKALPGFGRNVVVDGEKSYLSYLRQIIAGLETATADYIFMCEHDVLYNSEHFTFTPPRDDVYYYNSNVVKVRSTDGHTLRYSNCLQVSGLCASRELLLQHYRKRLERFIADGNRYDRNIGYEPGMRPPPRGIDEYGYEVWKSAVPIVDIRAEGTMSKNRWSRAEFRNKPAEWQEGGSIEGWGVTEGRFDQFLADLRA